MLDAGSPARLGFEGLRLPHPPRFKDQGTGSRAPTRPLFVFIVIVPPNPATCRDGLVPSLRPLPHALPEGARHGRFEASAPDETNRGGGPRNVMPGTPAQRAVVDLSIGPKMSLSPHDSSGRPLPAAIRRCQLRYDVPSAP
jgi:hypothetical protein